MRRLLTALLTLALCVGSVPSASAESVTSFEGSSGLADAANGILAEYSVTNEPRSEDAVVWVDRNLTQGTRVEMEWAVLAVHSIASFEIFLCANTFCEKSLPADTLNFGPNGIYLSNLPAGPARLSVRLRPKAVTNPVSGGAATVKILSFTIN